MSDLPQRLRINATIPLVMQAADRIEVLEAALRIFLGDDDRFKVSVGGNPIAVERMLKDVRAKLTP